MTEGFKVVVVDPPWRYNHRANDVTHRARNQYTDMSLDEISALPIRKLAHSDCILWLWTTHAFMFDAIKILDAWGFRREEVLTWVKDHMGLGDWLRSRTEHCLLGIKGEPAKPVNPPSTLLEAPMRRHSRKPDEFYSVVNAVCGSSCNKAELFARRGWDFWGNEVA
jgi:N6-adenosine-specific RNA methylase IME4